MDLDFITGLLEQSGSLLEQIPGPGQILDWISRILWIFMLAGPVAMTVMGLLYCFAAPKEANHHFGFRCYYGMGSVEAWRYTQRVAGITWIFLGCVLLAAMLLVRARFAGLDTMELLTCGLVCVLIQAAALLLASLLVRLTVFFRFDRRGIRRKEKRKQRKARQR